MTQDKRANWTNEDLCAFVQEQTEEFGDQASVYAETMKKHKLRGRHLHRLKMEHMEELEVLPHHREIMLTLIQKLLGMN